MSSLFVIWNITLGKNIAAIFFYFIFIKYIFGVFYFIQFWSREWYSTKNSRISHLFDSLFVRTFSLKVVPTWQEDAEKILKEKRLKEKILWKRALEGFEHPFVSSTFSNIVNKASGQRIFFLGMLVDQAAGTLIS